MQDLAHNLEEIQTISWIRLNTWPGKKQFEVLVSHILSLSKEIIL